jgi:hypothetical protein
MGVRNGMMATVLGRILFRKECSLLYMSLAHDAVAVLGESVIPLLCRVVSGQ